MEQPKPIVIIGSINMDVRNVVDRFPEPGETITGQGTSYSPGGKGANQAVAASLAGGHAVMCGAVGADAFAEELIGSLQAKGVDTSLVARKPGTSGLAFITVEAASGENQIILSPGANGLVEADDALVHAVSGAAAVLLQNEIPWETGKAAIREAAAHGVPVYLNPAPAFRPEADVLALVDTLILNETEAQHIVGGEVGSSDGPISSAADRLLQSGPRCVIITLGADGVYCASRDDRGGEAQLLRLPAYKVEAVDTVAAGDTFIGAFAAARAAGRNLAGSLRFASAASAIAVTRPGAQHSIPTLAEIESFLRERGE